MSVTVAAAAKKIAVYLATDKRTWKVVGTIIGIAIAIVLLPVMLLLAMENQLSSAETQSIDYSDYVQNLSAQQQSQLSQMESDGTAIADALTKLNLKNQIVKAQMLYLTYFEDMSYAQAAEVTGKTVKQITNMVYRGKKSLRRLLEREGITDAEL